jgi:ABC-2 type transport system ATP-binding protein
MAGRHRREGAKRTMSIQLAASNDVSDGPPADTVAVSVHRLTKRYGTAAAVDDLSLEVQQGEIFGILGPNGAGKTTTIECIVGLRSPNAGTIRVLGLDPRSEREREELHTLVGVQLQQSALPAKLTAGEILELYHSFYSHPSSTAELADALGLTEKWRTRYEHLSGGQKQRLSIALALVGQPRIAVLDEMTTGLDPQARRDTWALIESARARGVTILLVTHSMDEAERLCDRVALIDQGRVVAMGTPSEVVAEAGGEKHVRFVPSAPFEDRLLTCLPEVRSVEHLGKHVLVTGKGELVNAVILALAAANLTANDVSSGSASLDDAFVRLTGRHIHDDQQGEKS